MRLGGLVALAQLPGPMDRPVWLLLGAIPEPGSRAIRSASTGDLNSCVQRAISASDKAAPDADLLRHLHEHIDAYMRGEGKDRDRLPDPTLEGAVAMLDEGLVYFIGGKLFHLAEIIPAAEELARAVAECTTADP